MLCALSLYLSGGTYSLTSTTNDILLRNIFMAILYLLSEFLPDICWEKIVEEIFAYFRFHVWFGIWTRALRLIWQHIIY